MSNSKQPTFANGKICYIEIPALDIQQSSTFYSNVFNWTIRKDDAGNISFDDAAGEVSGMWVTDRSPATQPGLMVSLMVYDLPATLKLIEENNGKILNDSNYTISEKTAFIQDPAGNIFCLYQHRR